MKCLQTKFHVDTMSHSKVVRSTISQNLSSGQIIAFGSKFSCIRVFSLSTFY